MDQPDLFGGEISSAYKPKPEHVRNSLTRLIEQLRTSDAWPWDEVIVDMHLERTAPYLLSLLDEAEAAELRAKWEAEVARLCRASAA
ncbi:MAG TPA: hypothetical protein VG735_16650 [Caulobacterales bacterium]|nr:hypothetical protein [Caulobacterales bacterium]